VRVIHFNYDDASAAYEAFWLLTTSEYYYDSVLFSGSVAAAAANLAVTQGAVALTAATYGSAWNFWPFKTNETS